MAEAAGGKGHEDRRRRDTTRSWRRHPGAFFENMLASHPFLPKTSLSGAGAITSPWTPVPAASTPPPASAPTTIRPVCATAWTWWCPVDDQGRHTDYAGKYAGMKTEESNPVILADMKESGALFASEEIVHSYPHCWRCKKPHHLPGHSPSGSAPWSPSRTRPAPPVRTCAGCPPGARTGCTP